MFSALLSLDAAAGRAQDKAEAPAALPETGPELDATNISTREAKSIIIQLSSCKKNVLPIEYKLKGISDSSHSVLMSRALTGI